MNKGFGMDLETLAPAHGLWRQGKLNKCPINNREI